MTLVDTHCHLDMLPDLEGALARMREAGVAAAVTIGVDEASSAWAVAVAGAHADVWATVGLHPHDAKDGTDDVLARLEGLAADSRVVGIGETGLDHHYDHSPRPDQERVFRAHIRLAKRVGKALVVHCREAWGDVFRVLEDEGPPDRLVFHCWSGSRESAERAASLGATLSFSGTITFRNADGVRAAAGVVPLSQVVVETDAPFLTPVPFRGRTNEPSRVPLVAAAVARAHGVSELQVATATTSNAARLFDIRLP